MTALACPTYNFPTTFRQETGGGSEWIPAAQLSALRLVRALAPTLTSKQLGLVLGEDDAHSLVRLVTLELFEQRPATKFDRGWWQQSISCRCSLSLWCRCRAPRYSFTSQFNTRVSWSAVCHFTPYKHFFARETFCCIWCFRRTVAY